MASRDQKVFYSSEEEMEGLDIRDNGLSVHPDFRLASSGFSTTGYPMIPMSGKRAEAVRKAILGEE
jgi:hypothetical protein